MFLRKPEHKEFEAIYRLKHNSDDFKTVLKWLNESLILQRKRNDRTEPDWQLRQGQGVASVLDDFFEIVEQCDGMLHKMRHPKPGKRSDFNV